MYWRGSVKGLRFLNPARSLYPRFQNPMLSVLTILQFYSKLWLSSKFEHIEIRDFDFTNCCMLENKTFTAHKPSMSGHDHMEMECWMMQVAQKFRFAPVLLTDSRAKTHIKPFNHQITPILLNYRDNEWVYCQKHLTWPEVGSTSQPEGVAWGVQRNRPFLHLSQL